MTEKEDHSSLLSIESSQKLKNWNVEDTEIKVQLISSIPSLYSFLPLLGCALQPHPNNQSNIENDILDVLATTKNKPQLIISGTSKRVGNWEFRTTITETIIYAVYYHYCG